MEWHNIHNSLSQGSFLNAVFRNGDNPIQRGPEFGATLPDNTLSADEEDLRHESDTDRHTT
jgi:hypothetical protein